MKTFQKAFTETYNEKYTHTYWENMELARKRVAEEDASTMLVPVHPLHKKYEALIDREDYELLLSLGLTGKWVFNNSLVRTSVPFLQTRSGRSRNVTLARVIADTIEGAMATYRDGDYLNLRRSNIVNTGFVRGGGHYHDRAILEGRPQQRAWDLF